ncbi:hydroxymethylglutaryl-CoA lyase [Alicyclobacillus fastidiosus]|uniref:Hydroxymethylglutaryl-CoA lyase n=1 Tax=Alicyclobacillus fastidiosus TaxID=392011 RepID=A0ABY6ZLV7_9BACL|nr:hydroxymethylglutaryl-CoA lyase [Alicyclobacillus fastidiosus]WAH43903.1 hydroxymethylglutaryl-CoA lyase [Alicyclobacillus fastidiosus]
MEHKRVSVVEVGPRDGLQNEAHTVSTQDKVAFVDRLADAGFRRIEVSSFVAPKWIPQLADAQEVFAGIHRRPGVEYSALIPNVRGMERALRCGIDAAHVFMSASETHNRKNVNKSIEETFSALRPVIDLAHTEHLPVRGYVSTAFGCPYEGRVPAEQVMDVVKRLVDLGVDEISLGDTIGVAVPTQVTGLLAGLAKVLPISRISLHLHDTRGTAMANVLAGLQAGVTCFDGSLGGLGGCPYAPGASGNLATDDLLYFLTQMGYETCVDEGKLAETAAWFESVMQKPLPSHARSIARKASGSA